MDITCVILLTILLNNIIDIKQPHFSAHSICTNYICLQVLKYLYYILVSKVIVNGNTRSKCFNIGGGGFQVFFNGSTMLHGVYGGEEGKPVEDGDTIVYAYLILHDACSHQPIIIQAWAETPVRILPVEGWFIEEFKLYNQWLGRGHLMNIFIPPQNPTMPIEI